MRLVVVLECDVSGHVAEPVLSVIDPLLDKLRGIDGLQPLVTRVAIEETADKVIELFPGES